MDTKPYARFRQRSAEPVTALHYVDTCSSAPYTNGPYLVSSDSETMHDVVVPNYRRRIANGEIINNPCSYVRDTIATDGDGYSTGYKSATQCWEASGPISYRHAEITESTYYNNMVAANLSPSLQPMMKSSAARAKQLAISNMDITPYAFGEDAFEIGETLRFLRSPLGSLFNLSKQFNKSKRKALRKKGRRLRTVKAQTKAIADVWLQYQFAASPLVRSMADALEAYYYVPRRDPERLTARGFSTDEQSEEALNCHYTYSTKTVWWDLSHSRMEDYHASILYEVSNPIKDMAWRLGFRVKDVPSTLWQVMPLSFMVDRVWDVSSFVEGVTNLADPRVKILAGSLREKIKWDFSYQIVASKTTGYTGSTIGEKRTTTHFEYNRVPWSPSVSDTIPRTTLWNLVDSATKIADLSALVIARFT